MDSQSIRESLGNRPVIAIGAVIITIVALGISIWGLWPHHPALPHGRYFANEQTGELIVEPLNAIPPLDDAAGKPVLVRAVVYSTDGGKTKVAAYYQKYSDDAKKVLEGADPGQNHERLLADGLLVRLPAAGSPWVPANSEGGRAVIAAMPTGPNVQPCSIILP